MAIDYPNSVGLAHLPTPLQHLERTSDELGIELWIKRDDLTGAELSGNKVRKLEFLVADAIAAGADTLITCGGEQSNHCRATAMAAARCGMRSVILLRTKDPANPPATEGNILLDRLVGADIVWISFPEYARRHELMAREAERVTAAGGKPYVIPEGGSNAVGSWGYIRACEELAADLAALPPMPTSIVYAAGSGGTGAGLVLGARMTALASHSVSVIGINVCDDRDYFVRTIGEICAELRERWPVAPTIQADDIRIIDGYVGEGYGISRPEELTSLRDLARREGIVLDPVYTGKAFYGITRELADDPAALGQRVVFLHSGGIFGLFPKVGQLEPLLL